MNNTVGVLLETGTVYPGFIPGYLWGQCCSSFKFSGFFALFFFFFFCLRADSYVPGFTGVTGLFILDCPFGFLSNVYLDICHP